MNLDKIEKQEKIISDLQNALEKSIRQHPSLDDLDKMHFLSRSLYYASRALIYLKSHE